MLLPRALFLALKLATTAGALLFLPLSLIEPALLRFCAPPIHVITFRNIF